MVSRFLYPRTVSIRRGSTAPPGTVGLQPYRAPAPATEAIIGANYPASIQSAGRTRVQGLPSNPESRSMWRVMIPRGQLERGAIEQNDIVQDDLGKRYQVVQEYWSPMGYNLLCERLTV